MGMRTALPPRGQIVIRGERIYQERLRSLTVAFRKYGLHHGMARISGHARTHPPSGILLLSMWRVRTMFGILNLGEFMRNRPPTLTQCRQWCRRPRRRGAGGVQRRASGVHTGCAQRAQAGESPRTGCIGVSQKGASFAPDPSPAPMKSTPNALPAPRSSASPQPWPPPPPNIYMQK
jgi:hypothetical protein